MISLFSGYAASWIVLNGVMAISLAGVVMAIAAYALLRPGPRLRLTLAIVLASTIVARIAMASYLSVGQYVVWSASDFGKLLLPPHQDWSYLVLYVLSRYWMAFGLALILTTLWYGFLLLIGTRSDRYLDTGEKELTALLVFAVGWPHALVLVPLAGIMLVLVSLVRLIVFRRELTTLGVPFMLAALVVLVYGEEIRLLFAS